MPAVLLIGPLPAQAAELQRRHPGLELRCITSSEGPRRVQAQARRADHVVLMACFCGHASQRSVTAAGRKPVLVHGGLSRLSQALATIEAQYPTISQGLRI